MAIIDNDVVIGKSTAIWHPDTSNLYGCTIGDDCNIGTFVEIQRDVHIGNNCKIQAFAFIPTGVQIGNGVFIGPHVCFTNDMYPRAEGQWEVHKTVVEGGASIGANSTICPGITIGQNAMIGAGSVVTKDVPNDELWVGNPARFLRKVI